MLTSSTPGQALASPSDRLDPFAVARYPRAIESDLAAREATHGNRADAIGRHDNVAREARYDNRRCRLERLVATQLADFKLLSHAQLDLALRAHTKLLEELPHRHVEGVFVHSSLLDSVI